MSTAASPSSDTEPSVANDVSRDAQTILLQHLHHDLDTIAREFDAGHRPHLDAGNADWSTLLQARHVREHGLDRIPLPEKAVRTGEQEDEGGRHDERKHRHQSDLQFRPGQRSRAWHDSILYDKNCRM